METYPCNYWSNYIRNALLGLSPIRSSIRQSCIRIILGTRRLDVVLGWISYFLLGFYTGVYYETFMKNIKNYTWAILLGAVLSIVIMVGNYLIGISTWVESKRFDIPFM